MVRIKSIDPANVDFADLTPLKEAIGNAQVVVLGEQSHGDGAVFLAKTRMIKYLHEECGFDVLVWESGLYDCSRVHEALKGGGGIEDFDLGVFTIWTRSAQVRPLLDYVIGTYKSDRPLEIAGYDCQITSAKSDIGEAVEGFAATLGEDHESVGLAKAVAAETEAYMAAVRSGDGEAGKELGPTLQKAQRLAELLVAERETLVERHGERQAEFMLQVVRSLAPNLEVGISFAGGAPGPGSGNARDRQMGENLAFLARTHYPDRKLIVWCATFHAVHEPAAIQIERDPNFYAQTVTGGQVAREKLGQSMYTIGFEADRGTMAPAHRPQASTLQPSPPNSVGAAFAGNDGNFMFLDLRGLPKDHMMRRPQIGRQLGYGPMTAVWPDQMDGIFFIREMFPSTRDLVAPEGYELSEP